MHHPNPTGPDEATIVFTFGGEQFRVDLTNELFVLSRHDPVTGIWVDEARVTPHAAMVLAAVGADIDFNTSDRTTPHGGRVVPFVKPDHRPSPDAQPACLDASHACVRNHPSHTTSRAVTMSTATWKS